MSACSWLSYSAFPLHGKSCLLLPHCSFEKSLAFVLSNRLADTVLLPTQLFETFIGVGAGCGGWQDLGTWKKAPCVNFGFDGLRTGYSFSLKSIPSFL